MDELSEQPHPYPRWIATAGWAGFALGIAMLLGGTWLTWILAAVTSVLIERAAGCWAGSARRCSSSRRRVR